MVKLNIKNKIFAIFFISVYCIVMAGCNDINRNDLIIKDAYLYLPLKGSDMSVGYLKFENNQTKKIVITSIECEKVIVSLHETIVNSEGMTKMKELEMFVVDPNSLVNFKPGGKHVMFSGLTEFKDSILRCAFLSDSGVKIPFTFKVLTNEQ